MTKKGTFLSILALLVAAAGTIVAIAAYFSKKKCVLCDDFDDFEDDLSAEDPDHVEYYAAEVDTSEEPEPAPENETEADTAAPEDDLADDETGDEDED